ncbi:MAG TPA: LysM peptidoglycan-binding domain-containing protein, partial [Fimbriimonadaceae bacterium]|nr:LysM peptidoglycan-binding domain-containing protein [Fimbriimonadaceae bacterium]
MLKRLTSVGACLAVAVSLALAQTKTYTVRAGDTLSVIADRFNVSTAAVARANGLSNLHKLKLGQKLVIPSASKATAKSSGSGSYVVRNGDHDWALAKRFGTTVAKLRAANPNVTWRSLQIGQRLVIPGASKAAPTLARSAEKPVTVARAGYTVKKNDNDWIIARKLGTTPTKLRAVNPGVSWNRLQIGQKLNVPGAASLASRTAPAKIRSRHAVITANDVTVRRGPSTSSAKIVSVDRSTQVTVLDHESGWYKLRVPRGTEGWVRGDYLKAVSPTTVAAKKVSPKAKAIASKTTGSSSKKSTSTMVAVNGGGQANGNAILDKAHSFRGIRYRYGGTSRSGFDCSGFTTTVFKSQGVKLPRTSAAQSKVGQPVSKDNLRPGDLVFFRTRGGRSISHVGIYQGNGKFIHASSGGGRVQ